MAELRDCVGIEVPLSPESVEALGDALTRALAGRGPAIALLPAAADSGYAQRLRVAVRPGGPVPAEVAVVAATSGSTGDPAGVLIPGSALVASADGFAELAAADPRRPPGAWGVSAGTAGAGVVSAAFTGPGSTSQGSTSPGSASSGWGGPGTTSSGTPGAGSTSSGSAGAGTTSPRSAGAAVVAHELRHRWVAALPLHHAGGFMVAVRAIVGGTLPVPVVGGGGAGRFSVDQLAAATQTAADLSVADGRPLAISLVPAQLVTLRDLGEPGLDVLRRFDVVLVGGAAAPGSLLASLRAQGVRVRASYGMTETCGGAVFDGVPLLGTSVTVDEHGRLRIEGEQVALGYRDGRAPDRWFRSPTGRRGFVTDDLGSVDPHGTVRVTGRRDDVVQVGGASVAVGAVADVLAADPSVREVEVVAVDHPRLGMALVAFVAPTRGACAADPGIPGAAARPEGAGAPADPGNPQRARNPEGPDDPQGPGGSEGAGEPAGAREPDAAGTADHSTTDPAAPAHSPAAAPGGDDLRRARVLLTDRLTERVVETLGPAARPRRILLVAGLPLAETGKRDRAALVERARSALADPADGAGAEPGTPKVQAPPTPWSRCDTG